MNRREEQALSNAVMNYLAIKGILHYKTRTSGVIFHRRGGGIWYGKDRYSATQRGAADILAWHEGKAYAFELKATKGKLSPEQSAWLERFNEAEGIGMVVRSLDEVINIFDPKTSLYFSAKEQDSGPTVALKLREDSPNEYGLNSARPCATGRFNGIDGD